MEDEWMHMIETLSAYSPTSDKSYSYGTNIPGKPRAILQSPGGRTQLFEFIAKSRDDDHQGFVFDHATAAAWASSHTHKLPDTLHVEDPPTTTSARRQPHRPCSPRRFVDAPRPAGFVDVGGATARRQRHSIGSSPTSTNRCSARGDVDSPGSAVWSMPGCPR